MTWRLRDLEGAMFFDRMVQQKVPWLMALDGCSQNPVFHAEGDVLIHTGLVCRALVELAGFQGASPEEQQILAWAALLHDVAKPDCHSVDSDGKVGSPGHALKGSFRARRLLWELDCPFPIREEIVGLVAHHMTPPRIFERDDPTRLVRRISLDCRCRLLAILAEADARARICPDQAELLERISLFAELAQEAGVGDGVMPFVTPLSRYLYFQGSWHQPDHAPFESFRCRVVMLSGLPGAGKDTWIARHYSDWPVVSLDAVRERMGIAPSAPQGAVIDAGREMARVHLRQGHDFVWNATNISSQVRRKSLSLFADYGAEVTIVYLECPRGRLLEQNRQRKAVVPASVMEKLMRKWEVPSPIEAHQVQYHAD